MRERKVRISVLYAVPKSLSLPLPGIMSRIDDDQALWSSFPSNTSIQPPILIPQPVTSKRVKHQNDKGTDREVPNPICAYLDDSSLAVIVFNHIRGPKTLWSELQVGGASPGVRLTTGRF